MDILAFIAYVIAFAVGSLAALLVTRNLYPATSEDEALAELEGTIERNGATR